MKKVFLTMTLLISIFFLAACSSNQTGVKENNGKEKKLEQTEKKDEKTDKKDTDVESSSTKEKKSLQVAMLGKDIKVANVVIAKALGYFEEEGLEVEFKSMGKLSDAIAALSTNKVDVLPFGAIPSASYISQGSDVVIFGGTISQGSEGLSKEPIKITKLEEFEGKKIGSFRMETGHMVLKGLLKKAEIKAEFVYLESSQAIVEAVKKGEVDFGMVNSGFGYVARKNGVHVAYHAGDFEKNFPCCRQTASPDAFLNKKDELKRFEIALLRAYKVFLNDKETSIKALSEYSGQDKDYVESIFYGKDDYKPAMIVSLDPNKNKMIAFYETMKENGDIDKDSKAKIEDHIDSSIYDSALEELIKRGENKDLYTKLLEESKVNNK